jgi:hypothetical protein
MESLNELLAKRLSNRGVEDAFLRNQAQIMAEISSLADELEELDDLLSEVAQSLQSSS